MNFEEFKKAATQNINGGKTFHITIVDNETGKTEVDENVVAIIGGGVVVDDKAPSGVKCVQLANISTNILGVVACISTAESLIADVKKDSIVSLAGKIGIDAIKSFITDEEDEDE